MKMLAQKVWKCTFAGNLWGGGELYRRNYIVHNIFKLGNSDNV